MSDDRTLDDGDLETRLRGALREIGDDALGVMNATAVPHDLSAPRRRGLLVPLVSIAAVVSVIGGAAAFATQVDADSDRQPPVAEGPTDSPSLRSTPPGRPGGRSAVDWVSERASQLWREPGFGKVKVDYGTATVHVYWHGSPPPEIERLRNETIDGVFVDVIEVPYNDADMAAAGRRVLSYGRTTAVDIDVSHTFPAGDFTALVVAVVRSEDTGERGALEEALAEVARMPVVVEFVKEGFVDGGPLDLGSPTP